MYQCLQLLSVNDTALVIELQGADTLWALKSRIEVPLENVTGAEPAEQDAITEV